MLTEGLDVVDEVEVPGCVCVVPLRVALKLPEALPLAEPLTLPEAVLLVVELGVLLLLDERLGV